MSRAFLLFAVFAAAQLVGAGAHGADSTPDGLEFFEKKIRPVLVDTCYKCHGPEAADAGKLKGGLRLDSREAMLKGGESGKPAVVPGNAEASVLVRALRHTDPDLQMPPKKKLGERQIADFVIWVNLGAPDPRTAGAATGLLKQAGPPDAKDHWSFQPPKDAPVPQVKNSTWVKTPIDAFVLAKLESKNLLPSPEADKRTLIRRATYDLTGLPPTPAEVDAFLADSSPDAYDKLVDRFLASPRYGERWGRYWLDLARYSDTKGYVYADREEVQFVHAHAYRDWVIKALNADLPYDQFLLQQLAADQLLPTGKLHDDSNLAAMGFLTIGRRFLGIPHDIIDDRIDVVTRTTQGLTVACARCHDHKFDPIPTGDYYSLYGVFANSSERVAPIVSQPPQSKEYADYLAELKKRSDKLESTFNAKRDGMVDRLRRRAPDYLTAVLGADQMPNELFYENVDPDDLNRIVIRQWQQYLFRRGKTGPDPVFAVWHALAALPANEFASKGPGIIQALSSDAKNKLNPLVARAFSGAAPASMTDVAKAYGKLLADVDNAWREAQKNPAVTALPDPNQEQLRQILYGPDSPARIPNGEIVDVEWFFPEGTRVELGKLQMEIDKLNITHPAAPDHAVYLVDRDTTVKPRVFKRGNPATKAEEVPIQYLSVVAGEKREPFVHGSGRLEMARAIASPTNPLTARVMVNRVWAWHFGTGLVTTPSDFGTRCEPPTHQELLDYLARRFVSDGWSIKKLNKLIMTSAVYRQTSGSDNSTTAAAASVDPSNKLLWRFNRQRLDFEGMRDSLLLVSGELDLTPGGRPVPMFASTRRSVYGKVDRQFLPGVFRVFDFANPDLHIPTRPVTTVPQQALFFMNSTFVTDRAKSLAARPEVAAAPSPAEGVRRLYRLAYQREPTAQQVQTALAFIELSGSSKPTAPPPKPIVTAWQYGYGELDPAAKKMKSFERLGHFTGKAWQGGIEWPDTKLGWVQLTADGGHAGNDLSHAAVRRWTAPRDATVAVRGRAQHKHEEGDGIVASIVSGRDGILASYTLHNRSAEAGIEPLAVKQGDTLDFVVDFRANLNNDDFYWAPTVEALDKSAGGQSETWDAKKEFGGNTPPPPTPLNAWEQLAQVLLESNEFLFVD